MQPNITRHKQFIDEKFTKTGWIRQRVEDCRFAAVELYDTHVEESEYIDCKFSSVNWRNSKFKKVIFRNCIFDKVDFSGSEFLSCKFLDCEWQEIILEQCIVGPKKLDLTGTKFGTVAGISMLGGHSLSYQQAVELLPVLLHEKGIELEADS